MHERIATGNVYMDTEQKQVTKIAELSFARGAVGRDERIQDTLDENRFAEELASHTAEITKHNTADCGDDRRTLRLADGTEDPTLLRARVVWQLFGGLGLASTKAAVVADAAFLRDAKNIWDAYEMTSALLMSLGEEDGGHENCGASMSVEASVANPIEAPVLLATVSGLVAPTPRTETLLSANSRHKRELLESGFYSAWDADKHADYLSTRFPGNFSYLAVDNDHHAGGHHGRGLYVVGSPNVGFAKNGMIEDTGQEAFCLTPQKMRQIANLLGGSDEEREAITLGFLDDSLHVGAGIVAEGTPVFSDAR